MDVYACRLMSQLGHHARYHRYAQLVQPVRDAVGGDRLERRICDYDLIKAGGCRVSLVACLDIGLQHFQYFRQGIDQLLRLVCSAVSTVAHKAQRLGQSIIGAHKFPCPLFSLNESASRLSHMIREHSRKQMLDRFSDDLLDSEESSLIRSCVDLSHCSCYLFKMSCTCPPVVYCHISGPPQ